MIKPRTRSDSVESVDSCPEPISHKLENELQVGFSASGWLMMWQFGVAAAFQEAGYGGAVGNGSFVGSSGGSLVAGSLALGLDVLKIKDFLLKCSVHCRTSPFVNAFRLREYVLGCMNHCTNNMMHMHPAVQAGALKVSVTVLPSFRNELLSKFESNECVVEALLASCCMSPLAGFPFQLGRPDHLQDSWVFDGGLSQFQPKLDDHTISVSCFYWSKSDIKPSEYVPLWWALFPPSVNDLEQLFWMGFKDGKNWIKKNPSRIPEPMAYREVHITAPESLDEPCLPKRTKSAPEMDDKDRIKRLAEEISSIQLPLPTSFTRSVSKTLVNRRKCKVPKGTTSSWHTLVNERNGEPQSSLHGTGYSSNERGHTGGEMTYLYKFFSLIGDFLFVLMCLIFLTPMAYFCLYCELFSRAVFSGCRAGVVALEKHRRSWVEPASGPWSLRNIAPDYVLGSASAAWHECQELTYSLAHPRLLLSSLPVLGKYFHKDHIFEKLEEHSLVYRVLRFSKVMR